MQTFIRKTLFYSSLACLALGIFLTVLYWMPAPHYPSTAQGYQDFLGYYNIQVLLPYFAVFSLVCASAFALLSGKLPILIKKVLASASFVTCLVALNYAYLDTSWYFVDRGAQFTTFDGIVIYFTDNLIAWDRELLAMFLLLMVSVMILLPSRQYRLVKFLEVADISFLCLLPLPIEILLFDPNHEWTEHVTYSQARTPLAFFSNADLFDVCVGIIAISTLFLLALRAKKRIWTG